MVLGVVGCGPQVMLDDASTSEVGDDATTTGVSTSGPGDPPSPSTTLPPGTTSPPPPPSTTADPSDPTGFDDGCTDPCGCDFIGTGLCDWFPPPFECDVWTQDCPRGEKCMPWANDGGPHWNATRCSPVAPDAGQAGAPCLVEGSQLSGIDDCDVGHLCAWTDEANAGTCVPFCGGSEDTPLCTDPNDACVVDYEGSITLCLPRCDLLLQDCDAGGCWVQVESSDPVPTCGIAAPTLALVGETCEYDWDCSPGTLCHPADQLGVPCAGTSCCTPICDTFLPPGDCAPGQACVPVIPDGVGPGGPYPEGYCALP